MIFPVGEGLLLEGCSGIRNGFEICHWMVEVAVLRRIILYFQVNCIYTPGITGFETFFMFWSFLNYRDAIVGNFVLCILSKNINIKVYKGFFT
jgi:hypothetical protein